MDLLLSRLTDTVGASRSLEDLARPLLQMLAGITGMESTYLTSIDHGEGVQHVRFARNDADLQIPEGISVAWSDTLCKRALDDGCSYTDDVPSRWGDSEAARALGIQTYASMPVRGQDGQLLGTLCAASRGRLPLDPATPPLLQLFSRLVGNFVEREQLVEELRASNERLAALAMTDPLTELPNRRAVLGAMPRLLAQARRSATFVLVAMVDLDGFKQINDTRGHRVGDEFLQAMGRRVAATIREVDLLARVGGDEFVVLAPGPTTPSAESAAVRGGHAAPLLQKRLHAATQGHFEMPSARFDYGGASVGVVAVDPHTMDGDTAMQLADAEMYRIKQARKASGQAAPR